MEAAPPPWTHCSPWRLTHACMNRQCWRDRDCRDVKKILCGMRVGWGEAGQRSLPLTSLAHSAWALWGGEAAGQSGGASPSPRGAGPQRPHDAALVPPVLLDIDGELGQGAMGAEALQPVHTRVAMEVGDA